MPEPKNNGAHVGKMVAFSYRMNKTDEAFVTRPAIIHQVNEDGSVDLNVFSQLGSTVKARVPFSVQPKVDHWSHPSVAAN